MHMEKNSSTKLCPLHLIYRRCFSLVANHDLTPDQIETILGKLNNEQSEQQFMIEVVGDEVGKAIFFKK